MIKDCPMCKGLTVIDFSEHGKQFTVDCPNCHGEGYVEDIGDNESKVQILEDLTDVQLKQVYAKVVTDK